MKRLALFICTLLCANVLMAQTRFWVDSLQYNVTSTNPAEVEVYDAKSSITTANIPETVTYEETTYSVTSIRGNQYSSAFGDCTSLTSVTIPNSVTYIGEWAFKNCSSLTSVNIPNSVTAIGGAAFYGCSSLTSVTLPNNITELPCDYINSFSYGLFQGCSSLTSVTIPNSVTSIGDRAFCGCSSLTSVTIPNSVTSIGVRAFEVCNSLTSITIPNSVTSIGDRAFSGCSSLSSITIPNSVTSIGVNAFSDCSSLTSITIGNSVTSIGEKAFYNCSSLTSITIPNSVTSIGEMAFRSCSRLTSVTLPENATISNNAFDYVGTDVVIDSVTYSRPSANLHVRTNRFAVGFTTFYLGDNVYRNPVVDAGVGGCDTSKIEVVILSSIEINDMEYPVTYIGYEAFEDCSSLTSITIPNSITSIRNYAFKDCSSLTSIDIPNSVTSIGDYAFKDCSSLTSITFPNSVTSIGDYAFKNCSSLTSITIPNSVTSIGDSAFASCSSLTSMIVEHTNIPNLSNIGLNSILQNLTLGENVTSIASRAFNNYSFLQNVTCLATNPPTLEDNTVFPYPNIATLTVPCGTLEAYSAPTSFWNMFFADRISERGYNVEVSVNEEAFGSVAVESDCSTGTLTANANEGYRFVIWNDGNTDNPRTVALTSDTAFTAIFALIDESSLAEDAEFAEISLYPNPTSSKVSFNQTMEKVEVIDLSGKTLFTFSNANSINIESLPSGAYYLRLTNNDKAIMQKIIKE